LTSIFNSNANLSSIFNPAKQVFVKDVTHKVTMEVNEKGSKASAVTGIYIICIKVLICIFSTRLNKSKLQINFILKRVRDNKIECFIV